MSKVTVDEILGDVLKHAHDGGDINGYLVHPQVGFILTDSDGIRWRLYIETTGALNTIPLDSGFPLGVTLGASFISL